jgi:hypothetical protein
MIRAKVKQGPSQSLNHNAHYQMRLSLRMVAIVLSVYAVSFLFCGVALTVHAQSDLQTTKYRNMIIDLGNGLKTNARLNLPSNGTVPSQPFFLYLALEPRI